MRNPNGYGGISYMGKNRRNPYRVRITTGWDYDAETGKSKQNYVTLGYYPTRRSALIALADYNKDPYDLNADKITFREAFEAWSKQEIESKGQSRRGQLKAAFDKCEPLYNVRMKDLRKKQMQDLLDQYDHTSVSTQASIKSVFKAAFTFCLENDILQKDYSAFTRIKSSEDGTCIHKPYTSEEIRLLWNNLDADVIFPIGKKNSRIEHPVDLELILIYTGMRPSELLQIKTEDVHLEERYLVGGLKTRAGKNRIIPLHDDIYPLVEKRMKKAKTHLIPYTEKRPININQFRNYMHDPIMNKLGLEHLPGDGRHTFATFADHDKINKLSVKKIMGHASKDITDGVYTHKTLMDLLEAVNQIDFREDGVKFFL